MTAKLYATALLLMSFFCSAKVSAQKISVAIGRVSGTQAEIQIVYNLPVEEGSSTVIYAGTQRGVWTMTYNTSTNPNMWNNGMPPNVYQANLYGMLPGKEYYFWVVNEKGNKIITSSDTLQLTTAKAAIENIVFKTMRIVAQDITQTSASVMCVYNGDATGVNLIAGVKFGTDPDNLAFLLNCQLIPGDIQGFHQGIGGMNNLLPGKMYYYQLVDLTGKNTFPLQSFKTLSYR